ncbi:MAG TPA: hypothetical protein VKY86_04985 [Promicromonospora sp.]|nr:hypothetical protein [Promicromonospora sp.]
MIAAPSGRAGLVAVTATVVGAAAVACTGGGTAPPARGPVPADVAAHLTVEVDQGREQYAEREVRLRVTNDSDETLTLLSGTLDADGFGPSHPVVKRPTALRPGGTRAATVVLGEARCPGPERPAAPSATLALALGEGDGRGPATDVVVDGAGDPVGHLARNHEEDCAAAALAAGARLSVDERVRVEDRDGEPTAFVTLRVERVPGGPEVTLERVAGTTLMSNPDPVRGTSGWVGSALAGQGSGVVELAVVPARCDVHAVAEDKRGTFLPVTASVDGEVQGVVHVPMPDAARATFYDFVGQHCAWPE